MAVSEQAEKYHERMFPEYRSSFKTTDPEFIERFDNFAFDEVIRESSLDDRTRFMAILAVLVGCQGIDEFRVMLPAALNMGVTPVEAKEIVYQAAAYLGIGRVFPFLTAVNVVLENCGVKLPLAGQSQTTMKNRMEKGEQIQIAVFGKGMKGFSHSGPSETRHINRWLTDNCFGDYYTRSGLAIREREMITFCFLSGLGGCEAQLTAHASGNMGIGNSREFLIDVISQCVPYIGYPGCLNAIAAVNKAAGR